MDGHHRVGKSLLALGTLIMGLATIAPAYAAPRAPAAAPVEKAKVILGDTSIDGPSLWTANPTSGNKPTLLSVLAWTGTDPGHSLNIMQSSDGIHYGEKFIFAESSATRPAVAIQTTPAVTIVLAWTGTDAAHRVNLLCQGAACGSGAGREKKLTLGDTSITSPALVRFGDKFLLGWAGTDVNHSLNVLPFTLTTSGSGFSLGQKTILGQFHSAARPSLAVNPGTNQLLLSWAATSPAGRLTFATSSNGTSWSAAQPIGDETSGSGPAGFAVAAGGLPPNWVAWTGTDAARSVNVRFTPSFPQWPLDNNKATLGEMALGGPALGYVGSAGQLLLGWTGTDAAHHLNIATIATSTTTGVAVKVFFSKHPDSDSDPNKVFAVQRTSPTSGVATYAVSQLIAGPTASEKSTGLFTELTGALSGTSNCGGADFTITLDKKGNTPEPGTATLRFCRTTSIPGELAGGRMLAELNATLTQFSTIKKAVILNKDGNCFADLSGKNLCLA